MLSFTVQVAQNPHLAPGTSHVEAVVNITAVADATTSTAPAGPLAEAFLVDTSGSMAGPKIDAAREAVLTAINSLREDAWFCVISGDTEAEVLVHLRPADAAGKKAARTAVQRLRADGGTAMSTWLTAALREFAARPGPAIRHALLLTDGRNESEREDQLRAALRQCEGQFQCDARGVGTDWVPDQLRLISGSLLGTLDIIPRPDQMADDFRRVLAAAQSKAFPDASLRVWAPVGAGVELVRQVYPESVDLTARGVAVAGSPQVREYPTGAWGAERRDYHVRVRVTPGHAGQRMCAARVSLVKTGTADKLGEAMALAQWTDDDALSAVLNPEVAHYTGQAELADAIQLGLRARSEGDEPRATALLGRAVQIAARTNPETLKLLRRVVHIEDEHKGTVKLLKQVAREDEFALDTRSTKTARAHRDA